MIASSTVSPEAFAYIRLRLETLCAEHGVKLLFAAESGSRAWGFPSADSDYDVRFVYARPESDYRSVREFRDVIETPIVDDVTLGVPFDMNGWDIRKALQLGLKSNPILHEWLVSPIDYATNGEARDALRAFTADVTDAVVYAYHYDRLARSAWAQIEPEAETVKIKRYCYALRPVLMLMWLKQRTDLPPMDAASLCKGLKLEAAVTGPMADLFARKATAGEQDQLPRQSALDDLIAATLSDKAPRPPYREGFDPGHLAWADRLFARIVQGL